MKKCLLFIILVLAIAFWYSYAGAYNNLQIGGIVNDNEFSLSIPSSEVCENYFNNLDWSGNVYIKFFEATNFITSNGSIGSICSSGSTFALPYRYNYVNGNYYILINEGGQATNLDDADFVFSFTLNNNIATNITPIDDYTSRIDNISLSTSTNKVNLTGYWNATTTSGVYEQLEFYQINTILGQEDYFTVNATTSGAFNIDFDYRNVATPYTGTTTKPITANTTFYVNLYEKNNAYYNPFGDYDIRYETLLDATTTFLIASTTDYFNISTSTIVDYPEYECAITSLTGCFKNALIWTFYPSQQTIGRYYALVEVIQKKPPIGYFYITKNAIISLSASSTSAFNITIPAHLKTYIFTPLDAGLAGLAWIFFVFAFYKRLKDLKI